MLNTNNVVAYQVVRINKKTGKKTVLNAHKTQAGARSYAQTVSWFYRNSLKNDYVVVAFVPHLQPIASIHDKGVASK